MNAPGRSEEINLAHPLHSPAFFAGDPYPTFRELRGADPVCWNSDAGFWALLKYEAIRFVSTNPALFSSAKRITITDPAMKNAVLEGTRLYTGPLRRRRQSARNRSQRFGERLQIIVGDVDVRRDP